MIKGCVKIQLRGLSLEKFLNISAKNDLHFWDVERVEYTCITAWMDAASFIKLRSIAREVRCDIKIIDKRGLPFFLWRYRLRKMLFAGGVACILGVFIVSRFVWDIRVEGNESVRADEILQAARSEVWPGKLKASLNYDAICDAIVKSDSRIAWAGTRINGTRLTLSIIENENIQLLDESELPSSAHIVSQYDAIISKISVVRGRATVVEGQSVKVGDILVSGILEAKTNAPERYVYARGEVKGRVWYTGESEIARDQPTPNRTGEQENAMTLILGDQRADVGGNFKIYDAEDLGREGIYNLYIPLEAIRQKRHELKMTSRELTDDELKEMSEEESWQNAIGKVPTDAQIVAQTCNYYQTPAGIRAVTVVEAILDIGRVKAFDPPVPTQSPEPTP